MPPKPLEAMLKSFTKEYLEYTDGGTFIRYTGQTNGIDIDDFVKIVWAEALRYGAECLPDTMDTNSLKYARNFEGLGFNEAVETMRQILLEEADKATKNV